jgi:hypothetical protein
MSTRIKIANMLHRIAFGIDTREPELVIDLNNARSIYDNYPDLANLHSLQVQCADNQQKILELAKQDPAVVDAVVAAVNGSIGGRIRRSLDDEDPE